MPRTFFFWMPSGLALFERRVRENELNDIGRIEDAPYLGVREPRGLAWLFGRKGTEPLLRPPFNERGEDVHRLLAGEHEAVGEDAFDEVRLGRGTIRCLEPREDGDEVVLRDAWSTHGGIACRIVDAVQFALVPDAGRPIAVAFAQAPLVINVPQEATLATVLGTLGHAPSAARVALLRHFRTPDAPEMPHYFNTVELRQGDRIEVLGMALDARLTRRFDLGQRTASYRETSNAISLVLGDAPGLRMVIRKLG
jgi:hypothetical protein